MKKSIQTILIILILSLGASIRLGVSGWLFIVGLVSIILLFSAHLFVHFYSMNHIARKEKGTNALVFLSHLSFLGLLVFQTDFDDSRSYSAVGHFLNINSDFLVKQSTSLLISSFTIYLLTSFLIIRKSRKVESKKGNLKLLLIAIPSSLVFSWSITAFPIMINHTIETKQYNDENYPELQSNKLDSVMKNTFPNSISLSHRINESDGRTRWVNQTFTNQNLNEENKINQFSLLDSISLKLVESGLFNTEVVFNYYYTVQSIKIKPNQNKINFFDYSNFDNKYDIHYRVDCDLIDSEMTVSKNKLNKNISERQEADLEEEIKKWYQQNHTEPISRIFMAHSQNIDQELNWIMFIVDTEKNQKHNLCINKVDKRIKTCGNTQ